MTEINSSAPVLVTGATGYVAGWLVKKLLEKGHTVHAAVRNPDDEKKLASLKNLARQDPSKLVFFKTDLLQEGSYAQAMQGCELVFHTASPFVIDVEDPQRDLVDPAVNGTANILNTASKVDSVKRVVLTSSCASIYGDNIDIQKTENGIFTENDWNTTSSLDHVPYSFSKVSAERKAWEIAGAQDRWDLVVINPSFVLGPAIDPQATSESFTQIIAYGDGTNKAGVPLYGMATVDVRDVADAHYAAGYTPSAKGRHIVSGKDSDFLDIALDLHKHFGDKYPIPNKAVPKFLLWLIGPIVTKGVFTRKIISNNVGHLIKFDNTKAKRELGITFRDQETALKEMFQQLIDADRISS